MADHASGFCVYNDCAVAISWLLDHGFDRVAYLDVDVHHGDGVQAAFIDDPRVLTISVHQHPMSLWPGTGWPGEVGNGRRGGHRREPRAAPGYQGRGVAPGLPRRGALAARPRSGRRSWSTQCGADTHHEDPLAELSLSVDGHLTTYRDAPRAGGLHRRRQVAGPRRRRVRAVPGGAAVLDPPAGHRARP